MHPFIGHLTHDSPAIMLLILVSIAAFLVPLHHNLEHWVKKKLVPEEKAKPDEDTEIMQSESSL
jgi:hypothetical protein